MSHRALVKEPLRLFALVIVMLLSSCGSDQTTAQGDASTSSSPASNHHCGRVPQGDVKGIDSDVGDWTLRLFAEKCGGDRDEICLAFSYASHPRNGPTGDADTELEVASACPVVGVVPSTSLGESNVAYGLAPSDATRAELTAANGEKLAVPLRRVGDNTLFVVITPLPQPYTVEFL